MTEFDGVPEMILTSGHIEIQVLPSSSLTSPRFPARLRCEKVFFARTVRSLNRPHKSRPRMNAFPQSRFLVDAGKLEAGL